MAALVVSATAELRRRAKSADPFDPSGLHTRLSWALLDAAERSAAAREGLTGRMAAAFAARLRGMGVDLSPEQKLLAIQSLEEIAMQVFEQAGRPLRLDEIDDATAESLRIAQRRVGREART
jgi:hypothetical protein